MLKVQDELM